MKFYAAGTGYCSSSASFRPSLAFFRDGEVRPSGRAQPRRTGGVAIHVVVYGQEAIAIVKSPHIHLHTPPNPTCSP